MIFLRADIDVKLHRGSMIACGLAIAVASRNYDDPGIQGVWEQVGRYVWRGPSPPSRSISIIRSLHGVKAIESHTIVTDFILFLFLLLLARSAPPHSSALCALRLPRLSFFLSATRKLPRHIGSGTTAARPPRGGRRWCHCDAPTGGLG